MKIDRRQIAAQLPTLGIFAFALASVWSLYQLFNNSALHPTPLYWIPAALVELVTAWLAFQSVEAARQMTRSNISKQDKRFAKLIFGLCVTLAVPTLAVSFAANSYEFRGHFGLASLFPVSCVACAVASAIPHVKTQVVDAKLKEFGNENKELRNKIKALEQSSAMNDAPSDAWQKYCTSLNGNGAGKLQDCVKWYNDNGWYAPRDSTLRARLKEIVNDSSN